VAKVIFGSPQTRHLTINHSDAAILRRHLGKRVWWLPNLTEPAPAPAREQIRAARVWLRSRIGSDAPVWLLPCRLLRRKNVAEALLLTRWLRPGAWLVTTGGVSSADEQNYFERLSAAAHAHHWRLRLGVLTGDETHKPEIAGLLAASEAVLLTSIQEGFGLPYLEAAAAKRPLIARMLPNISPDLEKFGFRFPQGYGEILISTTLFDWPAEHERQKRAFRIRLEHLPQSLRKFASQPSTLSSSSRAVAVPFSRLTLTAQLEVLAQPVSRSWEMCAPLNRFLVPWRQRAIRERLQVTPWPATAARWLSGQSYARKFLRALRSPPSRRDNKFSAAETQAAFIRKKLATPNIYPLLWHSDP